MRKELPSLRQFFKRIWLICIGAAVLLLLSFGVLESVENRLERRQEDTVAMVNMLGMQRMHSQMLVRLALQSEHGRSGFRQYYLERLRQVWDILSANQTQLRSSNSLTSSGVPVALQEAMRQAERSFASLDKEVQKLITRLDSLPDTGTPLFGGMGETFPSECDAFSTAMDKLAETIVGTDSRTVSSIAIVGWLRMSVAGLIVLTAVFLLTRGQLTNLKRLIDTGTRFEELTYLQNAVLESTAYSIISTTPDGTIVTFNRGAENMTGYSREDVVGIHTPELLHDASDMVRAAADVSAELAADIEPGFEVLVAHARRGEASEREWNYVRRDGGRVPVSVSVTAMRNADGLITGFLTVARDITEKKKLEQQFLRSQRIESIGTLAGGIAHDLNNVLTPILMSIELLRVTNTSERSQGVLASIESSAKRGADLVKQILSFARGVDGERTLIKAGPVIKDIQKLVQDTFPKNIRCAAALATDLPSLLGDPTQLHQILLNLCVNARDAMPNGGSLSITAKSITLDESAAAMQMHAKPGTYVSISVKDTGTGIPHEVVEKVFDPFFTTKEVGKGTGLGLSTVLAIAKSHGGFVKVVSEPGQGSTFTVCLPAMSSVEKTVEEPVVVEQPQPMRQGAGQLILIVDDEENVRNITQQTLETLGYRTMGAADGVEAVALYSRHNTEIAAVLTDMMMPIMSGPATIQVLQRINPAVKIIAASGITQNGGLAKAAEMGIKHLLPKPYSAQSVMSTLHKLLN
ncbi:MAG: hybrid sensor histidine kinase/response regulator [Prosthecobacter sp.]